LQGSVILRAGAGRAASDQNGKPMRRAVSISAVSLCVLLSSPAGSAAGAVAHTVAAGETLWSIATANGLSTRSLAAYNGLAEDAQIRRGATIDVPTTDEAASAIRDRGRPSEPQAGSSVGDAHQVRWGETLSGIAANAGISTEQLARFNGLDPAGPLLAGTVLRLPGPSTGGMPSSDFGAETGGSPANDGPVATPDRVSYAEIAQIAQAHGVPPSLAAAVAWQESGFNNGVVSSANARGVMQVLPGTWSWIQQHLAGSQLDPASPHDNVHAGVMYIQRLLRDSGGDVPTAVASYYQGEASVRRFGMLPGTWRYVQNVISLRGRFGGP
jgi:N-acetylmuramoyl-L-alanine amidase